MPKVQLRVLCYQLCSGLCHPGPTPEPKEQHLSHLGLVTPSMQQRVENMRLKTLESVAGVWQ